MSSILSIQIGEVETLHRRLGTSDAEGEVWQSAFRKRGVEHEVEVTVMGLVGDAQADRKHHGGHDKAILMYAAGHYEDWRRRYPTLALDAGAFGENMTVDALCENNVCIGDVYRIGDVLLEVSQPRIPCWKISERWGEASFTDAVRDTGRTGWYVRVKETGRLVRGMEIDIVHRPHPSWSIAKLNAFFADREQWTRDVVEALQEIDALSVDWKRHLRVID